MSEQRDGGAIPDERRYGDDEIVRILSKATELQARAPSEGGAPAQTGGHGLTLAELRQVASEAGIDPRFIDLAASTLGPPAVRESSALAGVLGLEGGAGALPAIGVMAAVAYGATRSLWPFLSRQWDRRVRRLADRLAQAAASVVVEADVE